MRKKRLPHWFRPDQKPTPPVTISFGILEPAQNEYYAYQLHDFERAMKRFEERTAAWDGCKAIWEENKRVDADRDRKRKLREIESMKSSIKRLQKELSITKPKAPTAKPSGV